MTGINKNVKVYSSQKRKKITKTQNVNPNIFSVLSSSCFYFFDLLNCPVALISYVIPKMFQHILTGGTLDVHLYPCRVLWDEKDGQLPSLCGSSVERVHIARHSER